MKILLTFLLLLQTSLHALPLDQLKELIYQKCAPIEGWASQEKVHSFIDLILEIRPRTCVEIGVFGGKSIVPIAMTLKFLKKGIVIGIDPWNNNECIKYLDPLEKGVDINWWSSLDLNAIHSGYIDILSNYDLNEYCQTIVSTSANAYTMIDRPIDFLHIDGNQAEDLRALDVLLYLPKVRSGGYICLNDTLYVESQPAIELLMQSCDVIKLIDLGNCIFFRKR